MTLDAASVLIDGPWEHRLVSANGARFHVAEIGDGPLVLLMHGFPQHWYCWRHVMVKLADAGYHVAAMDLRGYGASDKPPRGYDTYTGTADAAALVRALGESQAIVIGQGLGAWIAWCMPALQPDVTAGVAALSMGHPKVIRSASWRSSAQRHASGYLLDLQVPFRPERLMTRDHRYVEQILRAWAGPFGEFPTPQDVARYGDGMMLPFVAHSAAEHYRWLGRSQLRPDGPMFTRRIGKPIAVPVLHLQGSEDSVCLPSSCRGSADLVCGPYRHEVIDGAGHFLAEEAPDQVADVMQQWLPTVEVDG